MQEEAHRVLVECVGRGSRGPLWDAWLLQPRLSSAGRDKIQLCSRCHDPEHDAARQLLARDYVGKFDVVHSLDQDAPVAMTVDIARAAKLSTWESATRGLKTGKWKPHHAYWKEADDPEAT